MDLSPTCFVSSPCALTYKSTTATSKPLSYSIRSAPVSTFCRQRRQHQRLHRPKYLSMNLEIPKGTESNPFRVAVLEGDGAGPKVIQATIMVLKALEQYTDLRFEFTHGLYGEQAIKETGHIVPPETIELCRKSDAVLRGYQGQSRFTPEHSRGKDSAHSILKAELGLFAQIRPVKVFDPYLSVSAIKPEILKGTDLMIVREVSAGAIPASERSNISKESASSQLSYTEEQVFNVARIALNIAEQRAGRILNVDKADAMNVSAFWRTTLHTYFKQALGERTDILLTDMFVDDFCRELVLDPPSFDTIITSNLFGDILSEVASGISGNLRLSPSAWFGTNDIGVYGPADLYNLSAYPRGSQEMPMDKGQFANPIATIRAASMMLRYSLKEFAAADLIQNALVRVMSDNVTAEAAKYIKNKRVIDHEEFAEEMVSTFENMRTNFLVCDPEICGD